MHPDVNPSVNLDQLWICDNRISINLKSKIENLKSLGDLYDSA